MPSTSTKIIKRTIVPLLALSSAYLYLRPSAPSSEESTTFLDGDKVLSQRRIVALGDLHGDYQRTLEALKLADLIDENNHWNASAECSTTLVQTGDVTDRG